MAGNGWNGSRNTIRTRNILLQDWERRKAAAPLGKICFTWEHTASGHLNAEAWLWVNGCNGKKFAGIYAGSFELKKPLTGAEKPQVFLAIFGQMLEETQERPDICSTGISFSSIEDLTEKAKAGFEKWNA